MRDWGRHTYGSPLYETLAEVIAGDEELLRVVNRIGHNPPPNLLLAAVQFLLLGGADHELGTFYPSKTPNPAPLEGVGPAFHSFVLDHEEEIVEIGNTRYTQTNECRRCVALLPMVLMSGFEAFHLIDVGTSAGLNLAIDRYRYLVGDARWGLDSPVVLEAESRGAAPGFRPFEVLSRTGLDLHPIDPGDPDERRWLDALIWPEHAGRRSRLRLALDVVTTLPRRLVAGDAVETVAGVLEDLPAGEPAVVMNSFTLMQLTPERRQRFDMVVAEEASRRPVYRASIELLAMSDRWSRLDAGPGAAVREVGRAHPHGEWIELYARP